MRDGDNETSAIEAIAQHIYYGPYYTINEIVEDYEVTREEAYRLRLLALALAESWRKESESDDTAE